MIAPRNKQTVSKYNLAFVVMVATTVGWTVLVVSTWWYSPYSLEQNWAGYILALVLILGGYYFAIEIDRFRLASRQRKDANLKLDIK